jgi:hypothetical protein
MDNGDQVERWRRDLSGRDPIRFLNTIPAVGRSGVPEGVELLERAGEFLPQSFWDQTIDLNYKKVTVREFRDEWLTTLLASLPHAFRPGELDETAPVAFISYSTQDRVRATQLAVALTQGAKHQVFLDHWQLQPGDRLRDRLATSIGKSGTLVLLVSRASLASQWVKEEIDLAVRRTQEDPRFRIIPVLLDDLELPPHLADLVRIDWWAGSDLDVVAQAVLDHIRGRPSFSARVNALTTGDTQVGNPYQEHHRLAGRTLLPLVAAAPELAVEANQLWFLWELFNFAVPQYLCTLKIGQANGSSTTQFELIDRWFGSRNTIELEEEQIDQGLWMIRIDPSRSRRWLPSELQFLGTTGRISFRSSSHPRTNQNPVHVKNPKRMNTLLDEIKAALQPAEQPACESFVYDLQAVVGPPGWRTIELVIGGVYSSLSLAYSPMVRSEPAREGGPGVAMELWDPFFGAMKSTELYRSQLTMLWEAEVDLRSNAWETLLGLA